MTEMMTSSTFLLAYVGPGLGGGVIATVIGILASFVLMLFAIVYYPIKRMIVRRADGGDAPSDRPPSQDHSCP